MQTGGKPCQEHVPHILKSFATASLNWLGQATPPVNWPRSSSPCYGTIRSWIKQAALDEGRRSDGTTTTECEELRKLRKELRRLKQEQDILAMRRNPCDAAWFAQETNAVPLKSSDS